MPSTRAEPEVGVMSNDFKIGEFSSVTYQKLIPSAVMILITIFVLLTLANELDVFALGEDNAKGLGMNTALMRTLFLLLAALLAGGQHRRAFIIRGSRCTACGQAYCWQ